MVDLKDDHDAKLRRLASAGARGLPINEIGVGTAVHFALLGFCQPIHPDTHTVIITVHGRAYAARGAVA